LTELAAFLEQLRHAPDMAASITAWRVLPARPANYGPWPEGLDPRLADMLATQGIERLYAHQSRAVQHALAGRDVVIVTPTASGKSLCYHLPVLHTLLQDPSARALYLFPTKALAYDQWHSLEEFTETLGLRAGIATYDGDTPRNRRTQIRQAARVLLSNPDMLHVGILPYHTQWHAFFSNLRYIIIDEMHQYRGIFGSHVANVLRRLSRICRFYGSAPQFICTSATIANPVELASRLTDHTPELVAENGAPLGQRTFVFYNPPIVDDRLGLRRSALDEAQTVANQLLQRDVQTVVFARSRLATELLLTYLRQDAARLGRDPQTVQGYRAGYLPTDRRRIEGDLRTGQARGIVATNALELGVDIGGLDACVMAGYPGTIASTWQQAGRAGRGTEQSGAVMIASASPLDQYMINHPDYFFGRSPEHALVNPDNLYVLLAHTRCAAYELPYTDEELAKNPQLAEILAFLEQEGTMHADRGSYHWTGDGMPSQELSLRTADAQIITIVAQEPNGRAHTIGQIDRPSSPLLLHEGAVYLHEGEQHLVRSLDWESGRAIVEPVQVDYYTQASQSTKIDIERVLGERRQANRLLAHGEVLLTWKVTGYKRLRFGTQEHLGWGEVDLPEQQMLTSACWMCVPQHVVDRLQQEGWWVGEHVDSRGPSWPRQRDAARQRDGYRCRLCGAPERDGQQHHVHHVVPFREFHWIPGQNENHREANRLTNLLTLCPSCHHKVEQNVAVQSTLSSLGRVLGNLAPLFLMCDPHDVSIFSDVQARQTGLPTIFFLDRIPGGVGLSEELQEVFPELLHSAAELIHDCPCPAGCPSCVGPGEPGGKTKEQVLRLIAAL